ncbi:MAG: hypothetical protein ACT7A5_11895 [Ferrovibrionaceae bacterium]|jgi:hypothetical protein
MKIKIARRIGVAAVATLLLAGCNADMLDAIPTSTGSSGSNSSTTRSGPPYNRLQELALSDGCVARYKGVPDKLRACMNQSDSRLVKLAIQDGCQIRYKGVPDKLRECLAF